MQREIENISDKNIRYIPLSEAGKILNTSRDYMNVLVRRGKLRAVKFGRNWVTTKKWIEEYKQSGGKIFEPDLARAEKDLSAVALAEAEEFRNLKRGLVLEREKSLEAKALIPEIKLSSRELHAEERKNILEAVQNRFKKIDFLEFERASKNFGILRSLRRRSGLKFGIASGLIMVLLITTIGFANLGILKFENLNIPKFQITSSELQANIPSDIFKNFPNDIPLFYRWFTMSLSKGFAFLKLKTPSELAVGELSGGEPKIIKPQETPPRIDTFDEALALDLPSEALAKEGEEFGVPGVSVSASQFTLIENRLSVVEASLAEQRALTGAELSLQKKTILGTLETLIGISKMLPTHPISTIVVSGQPATLTSYSIQPQVNTGFDRLSADYFTLAHDATINGHLTVKSGGEFNTLSVSGATTLTGGVTIGGALSVAGDTTLENVTVNGTFIAPNVSLSNASTTYLTVSNTAWIEELFATQNLSVATTTASNALTVQGNQFIYGGLGVGLATTTNGAIQTSGDVFVGRNLYVAGNSTILGASSADTLTINSSINSNLIPDANATRDIGSTAKYWKNAYISTLTVNSISAASTTIGGTQSETFTINSDNTTADNETETLIFFRGTIVPNALLTWNAATSSKRFEFNQTLYINNGSASTTNPSLTVQTIANQTAVGLQVIDNNSNNIFSVNPTGSNTTMINASTTNLTVSGNLWAGNNGAFMLADGTVGSPSLAFAADTDTGIFRLGDGKMSFATNATTSLTLDTGKVIAGNAISTATYQLEVAERNAFNNTVTDELRLAHYTTASAGNGLGTGILFYGQDAEGSGQNLARIAAVVEQATSSATFKSGLAFSTVGSGGLLEKMRIDNGGNVGIGTTSPSNLLSISGATTPSIGLNVNSSTGNWVMGIDTADANKFKIASSTAVGTNTRLTIDGSGKVGIGTTNPLANLQIGNYITMQQVANVQALYGWNLYFDGSNWRYINADKAAAIRMNGGSTINGDITFHTEGTGAAGGTISDMDTTGEKMVIKNGGNVGIGITNPNGLLSLGQALQTNKLLIFDGGAGENNNYGLGISAATLQIYSGTETNGKIAFGSYNGTSFSELMRIQNNGNVGIGTSTGLFAKLTVAGSTSDSTASALSVINSASTSLLFVRNDGNVGIGTTSPSNLLSISGATTPSIGLNVVGTTGNWVMGIDTADANKFKIASSTAVGTNTRLTIDGSGNVGIGTTSPGAKLDVLATGYIGNILRKVQSTDDSGMDMMWFGGPAGTTQLGTIGIGHTGSVSDTNFTGEATNSFGIRAENALHLGGSGDNLTMTLVSGNVGIGTTTPSYRLQITSDTNTDDLGLEAYGTNVNGARINWLKTRGASSGAHTIVQSGDEIGLIVGYGSDGTTWRAAGSIIIASDGTPGASDMPGRITFSTTPDGSATPAERMRIDNAGNVGIGTTTPTARLGIIGADNLAITNYLEETAPSLTEGIGFGYQNIRKIGTSANSNLVIDAKGTGNLLLQTVASGNVGIGTTGPAHQLQIGTNSSGSVTNGKFFINGGGAYDAYTGKIAISPDGNAGVAAVISQYFDNTNLIQKLVLGTIGYSGVEQTMVLQNGNVGIGTTTPTTNLTISKAGGTAANVAVTNGWLCVDNDGGCIGGTAGSIYYVAAVTGNSDVAENYQSNESLEAGDIVVATGGKNIDKATSTSQTVIGIISTKPGNLLGYDVATASSSYPVALSGRVPVKVSLENGPISIGDRISASSVPGVGMKAVDGETTVGIALESYDGTQPIPKILVFVNLGQPQLAAKQGTGNLAAMVTASGDLNMNGFSLLNVKSITGINGLWKIDENGNITAQSVNTQALTIGGGAASGVTIYDRQTTAPKCIYIEGGVIKTSDGACGATTNAGTVPIIQVAAAAETTPIVATTTLATVIATSTPIMATSTSATAATTTPTTTTIIATSTEPVIVSTTTISTATTTP